LSANSPKVAIIIVNWNRERDVLDCLDSLSRIEYPNYQIIVVDNASVDGSVASIQKEYSGVMLIESKENVGFVEGNNIGIKAAMAQGADYSLLLNNDTLVAPNFLNDLVAAAEENPKVAVTGPTIFYAGYPNVVWSAGGAINWRRGVTRMLGLDEEDRGQFGDKPRAVDFVTGCALLVKMRILNEVGLLDPRFFAYYEETEWCVRIRNKGFTILYVPTSKIWHKIGRDERATSPNVHYYMTRNRLLFLKLSGAKGLVWFQVLVFEYLRTLISWNVRSNRNEKKELSRAMKQGVGDYFRGRFGKREV
jgi:GT2 family glycosyltransferase